MTNFTGPLEDRIAIRELFGAYSDTGALGDREAWVALWTEDCHWTSHLFDAKGHDGLRETWDMLWANWVNVGFFNEIGLMRVEDDTATARSYAREIVLLKDGSIYKLVGRYDDTLRKVAGEWKFVTRHYILQSHEPPPGFTA